VIPATIATEGRRQFTLCASTYVTEEAFGELRAARV
jgi:hypothetical protein